MISLVKHGWGQWSADKMSPTCMLAVIFRIYVRVPWCQSHVADISIFLVGEAVGVNPSAPHNRLSLSLSGESRHLWDFSITFYSQHGLSPFLLSTWIPLWESIRPTTILLSPPGGGCCLPREHRNRLSWSWISYGTCLPFSSIIIHWLRRHLYLFYRHISNICPVWNVPIVRTRAFLCDELLHHVSEGCD